jgi:hypothetical protein
MDIRIFVNSHMPACVRLRECIYSYYKFKTLSWAVVATAALQPQRHWRVKITFNHNLGTVFR